MILGPIPDHLREHIRRAGILLTGPDPSPTRGLVLRMLGGGSGLSCALSQDGDVWVYDPEADRVVAQLPDGPRKILEIRMAAKDWPALADWLPRRTAGAPDCPRCAGRGYQQSPLREWPCSDCSGLGWLAPIERAPQ